MIEAKIICDSLNSHNSCRLTTFVLTYPRFIHSELLTHRMFSRNSASSRAIPIKRMIEAIESSPAMPEEWGQNQAGMQANSLADQKVMEEGKVVWLESVKSQVNYAKRLSSLGLHKQIVNRLLEPFAHMTTILSGTEFGNFFNLRVSKMAQPEFRLLATKMLKAYTENTPKAVELGDWHIPFGDNYLGEGLTLNEMIKIGVARCARVSYLNFEGDIDHEKDYKLHDDLVASGHFSPTEHVAFASNGCCGNFNGWEQYRKIFPRENQRNFKVNELLEVVS